MRWLRCSGLSVGLPARRFGAFLVRFFLPEAAAAARLALALAFGGTVEGLRLDRRDVDSEALLGWVVSMAPTVSNSDHPGKFSLAHPGSLPARRVNP